MVEFRKQDNKILFCYSQRIDPEENWMIEAINTDQTVDYKIFHFKKDDLYKLPDQNVEKEFDGLDPIEFVFAKRIGDYYKITRGILSNEYDIFIPGGSQQ